MDDYEISNIIEIESLSADMTEYNREFFDHMYECMENISNIYSKIEIPKKGERNESV